MTIELLSLLGATLILFLTVGTQGATIPIFQGFKWGLGARDEIKERSVIQGRLTRTAANHMEGLAVFAPLILILHMLEVSNPLTIWGALLFVGARVGFTFAYLAGIPVLRSAIWGVGTIGLLLLFVALFLQVQF